MPSEIFCQKRYTRNDLKKIFILRNINVAKRNVNTQKKLNFTINIRREKAEFFDENYK